MTQTRSDLNGTEFAGSRTRIPDAKRREAVDRSRHFGSVWS
jgi:hypothetical protein